MGKPWTQRRNPSHDRDGGSMQLFKVLTKDLKSCNGGKGTWGVGRWRPKIKGELVPCRAGYHLCRGEDLLGWLNETICEAEYDGEIIESGDKVVVRRARITRILDTWNEKTARLFACDCAERALKRVNNPDPRSVEAVKVARRFANGEATWEELVDARLVARTAAWNDTRDDARSSARATTWDAAWDAARAAALDATRAAGGSAVWDIARASAGHAARAAESRWQTKRLLEYLYPINKEYHQ